MFGKLNRSEIEKNQRNDKNTKKITHINVCVGEREREREREREKVREWEMKERERWRK